MEVIDIIALVTCCGTVLTELVFCLHELSRQRVMWESELDK